MYMFIQGRLWQDTGGSPPLGGPRKGPESQMSVSPSPPTTLPTQSPRNQQRPAPSECTNTPIPWGSSQMTLAIFPTPLEERAGSARPFPFAMSALWVTPKGRCSVQVESKEVSAHHVIAIHAVSGILHRVVDFSTEC